MRYYKRIFAEPDRDKQLNLAIDACEVYESKYDEARKSLTPTGRVESAAAKIAGLMDHHFAQLQDLESILEHLENVEGVVKQKCVIRYLEHYQKTLSDSMAKLYADADDQVQLIRVVRHRVANVRNQYLGLIKGIDILHWQISNVVKLKVVAMDDASF